MDMDMDMDRDMDMGDTESTERVASCVRSEAEHSRPPRHLPMHLPLAVLAPARRPRPN